MSDYKDALELAKELLRQGDLRQPTLIPVQYGHAKQLAESLISLSDDFSELDNRNTHLCVEVPHLQMKLDTLEAELKETREMLRKAEDCIKEMAGDVDLDRIRDFSTSYFALRRGDGK